MMSLVVCIGLIASCAGPPNEARSAAEQAIQDARNGDAEKYANDEFQATVDEFNKAEKHMTAKEFSEALTSYEKTIELATIAGTETGVGREISKADASSKLDEFQASWGDISKQIEKGRGRKAKALAREAICSLKSTERNFLRIRRRGSRIPGSYSTRLRKKTKPPTSLTRCDTMNSPLLRKPLSGN